MDTEETRRIWRERVEQGLSSGIPIKEWCELNHVGYSTFFKWAKRLRAEDATLPKGNENWIEISRTGAMNTKALATRDAVAPAIVPTEQNSSAVPAAASTPAPVTTPPLPVIRITLGTAIIEIPSGTRKRDIANTLEVVARL